MKRLIYILILIILLLVSCKRNVNYTLHGNVKHKFTNQNISGVYICLTDPSWAGSCNCPPYAETYTDNNGNYSFSIDLKESKSSNQEFGIGNLNPNGYDSTSNAFKFGPSYILVKNNEIGESHDLLLEPSGAIKMFIIDSTWNSINADSIMVESPYETKYIIKSITPDNEISFSVEPSQVSLFKWKFIKNGISDSLYGKNIFVPNWWTFYYAHTNYQFKYEIKF